MGTLPKKLLLCLSLPAFLQAADPPAAVDAALKARVQDFYQLLVAKKYRQAEQMVAEDTKDLYYGSKKPDVKEFKITAIKYAPDFLSAQVTVSTQTLVMFVGAGPQLINLPVPSYWKIEKGEWCWYVDQSRMLETPFGRISGGPDATKGDVAKLVGRIAATPNMTGVLADKTRLQLDPEHPKPQTVTLKNTLPADVTIQTVTSSPALKVEIAKPNLGADESTQATITPVAGSSERPAQLVFKIGPLGQTIQIALEYPAGK